MRNAGAVVTLVLCGLIAGRAGEAGQNSAAPPTPVSTPASTPAAAGARARTGSADPESPVAPEVITRDDAGHATVRATRITTPIRRDGRLEEAVYREVASFSDFIQMQPRAGTAATSKTDVWVMFDNERMYVSARCWESDWDRISLTPMRRDTGGIGMVESFGFAFDTFNDTRNGFGFLVTPLGAYSDGQITNGGDWNIDFNPVWDVTVGRFEGGWTVEASVPFASLRYQPGRAQTWRIQAMRNNRWKYETSYLTRVPPSRGGSSQGIISTADYGTLVGVEAPTPSLNLDIKPYVTGSLATDRTIAPAVNNHPHGDFGIDAKYGITKSLTTDVTYNPDFGQAEVDEQQVNLTRFSQQFPEKREFFLENLGLFSFGGSGAQTKATFTTMTPSYAPILFYSRRIGLNDGRAVPLRGGGRLTGHAGAYSIGALSIQSDADPLSRASGTNFSVIRVKRDILRRSSVGLLYTGRSETQSGNGRNDVFGVDASLFFFDNLRFNSYWAKAQTARLSGSKGSYRAQMDYGGDRYAVQLDRLVIDDGFNPETGFIRRLDMRRSYGLFRFAPRPRAMKHVRRFYATGAAEVIENHTGTLESRNLVGEFAVELQSGDRYGATYTREYEFLPRPFAIAPGVVLPVAGYTFDDVLATLAFGQQRAISGNLTIERGSFYNGHKTAIGFSSGRINVTKKLVAEPIVSINRVQLVEGSFTNAVVGSRVTAILTPRMFASALVQYGSATHSGATNVRLRWEYQPGSELFIVYNEQRDTLRPTFLDLTNRAFLVKFNRLVRF